MQPESLGAALAGVREADTATVGELASCAAQGRDAAAGLIQDGCLVQGGAGGARIFQARPGGGHVEGARASRQSMDLQGSSIAQKNLLIGAAHNGVLPGSVAGCPTLHMQQKIWPQDASSGPLHGQ